MAWLRNESGEKVSFKEYLSATKTVSQPLAILMTAVFFFISIAVILTLFFGARWAYRAATDNPGQTTEVQTDQSPAPTSTPAATPTPTPTPTIPNEESELVEDTIIPNTGPETAE